jgi:hypothetical protein
MAVYYVYSGAVGSANGTSWANAYTTLITAVSGKLAGDTFYVAHDHAETAATSTALAFPGTAAAVTKVICANRAGTVPPVHADRRATARYSRTGAVSLSINGFVHIDGIIFDMSGTSGGNNLFIAGTFNTSQRYDNCAMIAGSAANTFIGIGYHTQPGNYVELNNTTMSFSVASQGILPYSRVVWRNTPNAVQGTIPATLIVFNDTTSGLSFDLEGVDLSALGSGKKIVSSATSDMAGTIRFMDCKLDAAVTIATAPPNAGACNIDLVRCGASGNYRIFRQLYSGQMIEETTIVRTGGASDGTTTISWKVVTTANCTYSMPFECPPIAIWNDATGSSVTATVEGVWGGGAVPNDDDVWIDVEYLGDASSPMGSFVNDGKASLLETAAGQASSSETWGGSTTKFKLGVSFTAQQKGWIYCRVKVGKASTTVYIDPLVVLT